MTATYYQKKLGAMEDGDLDPNDFSHLDHVGVAVEALKKYGIFEPFHVMPTAYGS